MGFGCINAPSVGTSGQFESRLVQEIAFYLFVKDFRDRHNGGVFTSERAYLWERAPNDPNSLTIFDMMSVYFRNWVPPARFREDPSTRREGGFRKPDGMGISPKKVDGTIVTELIEVKPADNYRAAETQMREMLEKLESGIKAYIEEQRTIKSLDPGIRPEAYKFIGSPYIPPVRYCSFPLTPLNTQSPAVLRWICYKPTRNYRMQFLDNQTLVPPERAGIILYEIHSLDLKQSQEAFNTLPESIRQNIQEGVARTIRLNRAGYDLRLAPWDPDVFARNAAAKQALRDQMVVAGGLLLIGVVLLCVFAPPAGAAAAGVVGAELAAEATVATSVATVAEPVFLGYRVAPMLRIGGELVRYEEVIDPVIEVANKVSGAM